MTGSEVVYAVHKFEAENVDEISINVGEQVIVLEKDDGYNDGWWQGRNVKGQVGLFPVTYTSKQPLSSLPPTLETKIDSLENAISKMKLPTNSTTTNKQITNSMSSKNAQVSVIESLRHPKLKSVAIEEWSSEQVALWLLQVGFDKEIASNFKDQEITGDILLELTLDSLKELQVATFGKRFKIHSAINVLREEAKNSNSSSNNNSVDVDINHSRKGSIMSEQSYATLPEIATKNSNSTSYYHPKSSYPDDDLVSDYSTVIRNSRIQSPTPSTMGYTKAPKALAPRPSIPLDMDLIASSPRLSTLVERQTSANHHPHHYSVAPSTTIATKHTAYANNNNNSINNINNSNNNNNNNNTNFSHRPVSHNPTPSDWKGSTINKNAQHGQRKMDTQPRIANPGRYSFMRTSLMSPPKHIQSMLPASSVRRSEDVHSETSGSPDMEGWLNKQGDKYKTWNKRWFVLKSNNLFYFKSPKATRMKGIINLRGYRIKVDESIHPGNYCFKIHHDRERTFYFYTEHEKSMKDWLKALMKATIARDFTTPVMSSSTIPTVSLEAARKMRPRPPSTILYHQKANDVQRAQSPAPSFQNNEAHFSLMSLDESRQPIMAFSHQQSSMGSRAPSVLRQHRPMSPDNASEYSFDHRTTRFKDSGFNSTHGNGTLNSQASNHSSSVGQKTPPPSIAQTPSSPTLSYYPDEEDEDLIDPVHNALENHEQRYLSQKHSQEEQDTTQRQREYIDWINMNVRRRKINTLSDLRTGETLLELLESLSNKEIRKPINNPGQSIHTQIMDRTILAFQFMGSEGIELDGSFSVKDVLTANEYKMLLMLETIKSWYETHLVPNSTQKKIASGGTFGEEDQNKLRDLDQEEETLSRISSTL